MCVFVHSVTRHCSLPYMEPPTSDCQSEACVDCYIACSNTYLPVESPSVHAEYWWSFCWRPEDAARIKIKQVRNNELSLNPHILYQGETANFATGSVSLPFQIPVIRLDEGYLYVMSWFPDTTHVYGWIPLWPDFYQQTAQSTFTQILDEGDCHAVVSPIWKKKYSRKSSAEMFWSGISCNSVLSWGPPDVDKSSLDMLLKEIHAVVVFLFSCCEPTFTEE